MMISSLIVIVMMFSVFFLLSTSISDSESITFIDEHQNCEFWAGAGKLVITTL